MLNVNMITGTNTHFIEGPQIKIRHGVYPNMLFSSALKTIKIPQQAQYIIIWFKEDHSVYPTMAQTQANSMANLNGGVKTDLDFPPVATYGVYKKNSQRWMLEGWVDFDHWPLVSNNPPSLMPGLADGHYHPGKNTQAQNPVTNDHRSLLMKLAMLARTGVFPG